MLGTECPMVPTLSESTEPPSLLLLEAMLELEGISPTLPEWSTLLRGLLSHLLMLTPTTEATTEGMLDMVWDTMVSMVVMPAPMVWATVATEGVTGVMAMVAMVAEDTSTAKYVFNSSRDCLKFSQTKTQWNPSSVPVSG